MRVLGEWTCYNCAISDGNIDRIKAARKRPIGIFYDTQKRDEIIVFVYAHSSKREPICYFQISDKRMELTDILSVDNTVLTDIQHRLMAKDYCDAIRN